MIIYKWIHHQKEDVSNILLRDQLEKLEKENSDSREIKQKMITQTFDSK